MSKYEKSGIYAITNTQTGDRYIGSSVNIQKRLAQHLSMLLRGNHHSSPLQAAWDEYGESFFSMDVLEIEPDMARLVPLEQKYIDAEKPAYNVAAFALSSGLQYRFDPQLLQEMRSKRKQKEAHRAIMIAEAIRYFAPQGEVMEVEKDLDALFVKHGIDAMSSAIQAYDAKERYLDLARQWYARGVSYENQWQLYTRLHDISFGVTIEEHKRIKGNVEDLILNMNNDELTLIYLSFSLVSCLHITHDSQGFAEIAADVDAAGKVAAKTRQQIEDATGAPVVSPRNMIREPDGGLWGQLPEGEV